MKKEYTAPDFSVTRFESEDIITNSTSKLNFTEETLKKDSLLIYDF